jgi:hypothetical protein
MTAAKKPAAKTAKAAPKSEPKDSAPIPAEEVAPDETKASKPITVEGDKTQAAEPVEFNPSDYDHTVVEESDDDGTTREEGLNKADEVEGK